MPQRHQPGGCQSLYTMKNVQPISIARKQQILASKFVLDVHRCSAALYWGSSRGGRRRTSRISVWVLVISTTRKRRGEANEWVSRNQKPKIKEWKMLACTQWEWDCQQLQASYCNRHRRALSELGLLDKNSFSNTSSICLTTKYSLDLLLFLLRRQISVKLTVYISSSLPESFWRL